MKLARDGEFSMNKQEVIEFSSWLDKNPRERYKCFNLVVQAFIAHNNNEHSVNQWKLVEAL